MAKARTDTADLQAALRASLWRLSREHELLREAIYRWGRERFQAEFGISLEPVYVAQYRRCQ
jgi:hypothetical protein